MKSHVYLQIILLHYSLCLKVPVNNLTHNKSICVCISIVFTKLLELHAIKYKRKLVAFKTLSEFAGPMQQN